MRRKRPTAWARFKASQPLGFTFAADRAEQLSRDESIRIQQVRRYVFLVRRTCQACSGMRWRACSGLPDQLHEDPPRSATRGLPPKIRFNVTVCARLCAAIEPVMLYPKDRKRKVGPQKPCAVCGGTIPETWPSGKWKPRQRTCSFKCAGQLKRKPRRPRVCPQCKAEFTPRPMGSRDRKFCSHRCRLAFENARRFVKVECAQCKASITREAGQLKRIMRRSGHAFCGRVCVSQFFTGENSSAWRGGSDPNRGSGWLKIAEQARSRDGYRCRRCGKTQEDNKQRLSVDHIRAWREFENPEEANDLSNLASLCRACHSWKTNTLEKKWLKGDGLALQEYRRWIASVDGPD